ncbi:MAG: NADH-quinone oxidoreductase subunit NuoH [Candidatus Schekmanbacteria bacterium]|nr:MAG: NADH-quinone oxidoreductase subunit NuoH [Candidatus Schekmanbacteria bacterium]
MIYSFLRDIVVALIKIVVVMGVCALAVAYTAYLERKVCAWIQSRLGPMRVGYHGILQPIADGLKLFIKEDIIPSKADKILFYLCPVICLVPAFTVLAVIPWSPSFYITDINIGLLFIFAVSSLGVFGLVMAGWASNSKYPLIGGLRSAAQMVSYEVSIGLSVIGVLIFAESLSMVEIIEKQAESGIWFILVQPLGFFLYIVCALAETNRLPFDLPEAETELVAGYQTEYSAMKFAFFYLAEYLNMIVVSAIGATLFLGGWGSPLAFLHIEIPGSGMMKAFLEGLIPAVWFCLKVLFILFLFIWIRWTFPRYRYDQLMQIGWKILLPLSLINIGFAGIEYFFYEKLAWYIFYPIVWGGTALIIIISFKFIKSFENFCVSKRRSDYETAT